MSSKLILGYPKSGRFSKIKKEILSFEDISEIRFKKTSDIGVIDFNWSIDDIKDFLYKFTLNHAIELKNKYCIVKNIDFATLEKQELFLKYLEDSTIIFYFTGCYLNNIKSKALVSRLIIINHKVDNVFTNLSETLNSIYYDVKNDFVYPSLSHLEIWYSLKINLDFLIKFDSEFFKYKETILNKISSYVDYPESYVLELYEDFFIQQILKTFFTKETFLDTFRKLIKQFIRVELSSIKNFSLFLDATFISYRSSINVK